MMHISVETVGRGGLIFGLILGDSANPGFRGPQ
jgi:hypothetical protein